MVKILLEPKESIEIVSTGEYPGNMIVEVMDDGIITYRGKGNSKPRSEKLNRSGKK